MLSDEEYLRETLRLAKKGAGYVSPNPLVGAVVVKDGYPVGKGAHLRAGGPHAEVNALNEAGDKSRGATLYVNLEPCCHYGKTPPCVDLIIKRGIKRVVCAMEDPNPLVSGKGFSRLRQAGIEVDVGKLEREARRINETYLKYITTGLPFVTLKWAQTLDGKIATCRGDSRWISSEASRRYVHQLRSQTDAVLVGVETVIKDDPLLSVRLIKGRSPLKIVLDSRLRLPPQAKVLQGEKLIVATVQRANRQRLDWLRGCGVEVWELPSTPDGWVDIEAVAREAGRHQITSILIEGGAHVAASALKAKIVDRVIVFIAPRILGDGLSAVKGLRVDLISASLPLRDTQIERRGEDIVYSGYLV
ncbi:MAG: bifunctional diaminohydroxyphosphoribosylaminopyrimidine deaminase/5-amino-6-(5-phosphoribosylamino)uracil reductase RibD [Candidatus Latescibacterota bacterium]|nr:MAG: bifunctional diaminohydroxyphosphoribosylaminopyrimidine deaminase/5-amino-6-(5-phosphoribosylamino)uracil reductase RibD [Candidatus Latescibacterota bacterium]RKY71086.1 MAG: bifunctional diaminohydroxyphosphoribosylaminopyrimidine deaminase/5-amino-6-(5-phosphoribosylamino)uracil reductase RibD [Candidatus Latescibacterota bacterium]